jgi:hypothetical protein
MNRGRVGEERGSKEIDGCPLTLSHIRQYKIDVIFLMQFPTQANYHPKLLWCHSLKYCYFCATANLISKFF